MLQDNYQEIVKQMLSLDLGIYEVQNLHQSMKIISTEQINNFDDLGGVFPNLYQTMILKLG